MTDSNGLPYTDDLLPGDMDRCDWCQLVVLIATLTTLTWTIDEQDYQVCLECAESLEYQQ